MDIGTPVDTVEAVLRKGHLSLTVNPDNSNLLGNADIGPKRKSGFSTRAMQFVTRLKAESNTRKINLRLIGTSMAAGTGTALNRAIVELGRYLGDSGSVYVNPASEADTLSNWKQQYYGAMQPRARCNSGEGATPYTMSFTGNVAKIAIAYSNESDGGTITVEKRVAGGSWESAGSFSCNGTNAYQNNFSITGIDPTKSIQIRFTAPASGYGYIENVIALSPRNGTVVSQMAFGGAGIRDISGARTRTATGDMPTSATPTEDNGLIAAFAPTDTDFKPDAIFFSGFTNDYNGGADDAVTAYTKACQYAVANGSVICGYIEQLNSGISNGATDSNWSKCRKVFYAMQDLYPENVFVIDADQIQAEDLLYNARIHPSSGSPHVGDAGYGDPDYAMFCDILAKLGVPLKKNCDTAPWSDNSPRAYTGTREPSLPSIGSTWLDTSVTPNIKKKLVSKQLNKATHQRGNWEVVGDSPLAWRKTTAAGDAGTDSAIVGKFGEAAWGHNSTVVNLVGALTADSWYTANFTFYATSGSNIGYSLELGRYPNPKAFWSPSENTFVKDGGSNVSGSVGYSDDGLQQVSITFKTPSASELSALDIGSPTNYYLILFEPVGGGTIELSDVYVTKGSSAIIPSYF